MIFLTGLSIAQQMIIIEGRRQTYHEFANQKLTIPFDW
jgi:hypothetical protein